MKTLYQLIDNSVRGFEGVYLNDDLLKDHLKGSVFNTLIDVEVNDARLQELTGLVQTGFSTSETLLADIQALENATPEDLRNWRIGEALAEVMLEKNFNCRFHWNELRDARNPKGNKTGADLVGFVETNGSMLFLFGEIKTSSETANRPPQVMTKADGIENQLKKLYTESNKRQILITYLKSKTLSLNDDNQFKIDYESALRSYYGELNLYHLFGVLVRDVDHDEKDISLSYHRIKTSILEPIGLKLIALYTSISSNDWRNIITGNQAE